MADETHWPTHEEAAAAAEALPAEVKEAVSRWVAAHPDMTIPEFVRAMESIAQTSGLGASEAER